VPSVISVEGLRSPKAIAFIGSQLNSKTYSELRASRNNEVTQLLQLKNLAEDTLNLSLMKKMDELLWIN
jgi:hypothetical protein